MRISDWSSDVCSSDLYDEQRQRQIDERAASRKSQVGSGDRSERIRTYNFPQGSVTDHRINLTLYKLERVLAGEALDELIGLLVAADQAEKLAEMQCRGGDGSSRGETGGGGGRGAAAGCRRRGRGKAR